MREAMIQIVLAIGAFGGLVLLVILFRLREKYYTRAGIQTPHFGLGRRGTAVHGDPGAGGGVSGGGCSGDGGSSC